MKLTEAQRTALRADGFARGVEAAAKVAEAAKPQNEVSDWTEYARDKNAICTSIATAIRALAATGEGEG